MTATLFTYPDDKFQLVPGGPEDRNNNLSYQPENNPESIEFDISPYLKQEGIFDLEVGLFGETWAFSKYGNTTSLPTIKDMADGLKEFFDCYINEQMSQIKTEQEVKIYKSQVQQVIDKLFEAAGFQDYSEKVRYE